MDKKEKRKQLARALVQIEAILLVASGTTLSFQGSTKEWIYGVILMAAGFVLLLIYNLAIDG